MQRVFPRPSLWSIFQRYESNLFIENDIFIDHAIQLRAVIEDYAKTVPLDPDDLLPVPNFDPVDRDNGRINRAAWDLALYQVAANMAAWETRRAFFPTRTLIERATQALKTGRLNALALTTAQASNITHDTLSPLSLPPGVQAEDHRSTATFHSEHTVHFRTMRNFMTSTSDPFWARFVAPSQRNNFRVCSNSLRSRLTNFLDDAPYSSSFRLDFIQRNCGRFT